MVCEAMLWRIVHIPPECAPFYLLNPGPWQAWDDAALLTGLRRSAASCDGAVAGRAVGT